MAYDTMMELIEQFQSEGRGIDDLAAAVRALNEERKTPLGLNQWKLNDKPRMEEFNEDNRIIDRELRNKVDVGPPQRYEMELRDGATVIANKECTYSKNQSGMVMVDFGVTLDTGKIGLGKNMVLAILPAGFRPQTRVDVPLLYSTSNGMYGGYNMGYGVISNDGTITICMFKEQGALNSSSLNLSAHICFYAQ